MKTIWALIVLLVVALFVNTTTACSKQQAKDVSAMIEKAKVPAFNGAAMAFALLDDCNARYQDSIKEPTREQFAEAQKRTEALNIARDALAEMREWLSGKNQDLDWRGKSQELLQALDLVQRSLKLAGVPTPKGLEEALSMARVSL